MPKKLPDTSIIIVSMLLIAGCLDYSSKEPSSQTSISNDPESFALKDGYNSYVSRTFLKDGTEIGVIQMKDGSSSKYWFRSHHISNDIGGTWFSMSDGTRTYMAGWFCCEVQLPKDQFQSLAELKKFVREHHGISP